MSVRVRDLSSVLEPYRDRSSNYGEPDPLFADHLPMAVTALAAMGADDRRLETWAAAYASGLPLRPARQDEMAGREKWRVRIGHDGALATLRKALDLLGDGIGAAAFHAPIRAAYALERNDHIDLASALESWEREFVRLPVARTPKRASIAEAFDAFSHAHVDRSSTGTGLIADAMRIVGERDGFQEMVAIVPSSDSLDDLALAAAAAFATTGNFTALHLMTGTHAFRVLCDALGNADQMMPAFWSAYAAAAIVAGASLSIDESFLGSLRDESHSWERLIERAVAQDDDHVIKATYTAWRLDDEIGDPVFAVAAAHYLQKRSA